MMSPSLPQVRDSRRARARRSIAVSAGVSSMYSGDSCIFWIALVSRGQSSSCRRPVRSRCWSSRPTDDSMRSASCEAPISIEKTATGMPWSMATYSPMLRASEVLPIDGRPATMIRSPGWKPEVLESRSANPVGTPVTSEGLARSNSSWIRSTTLVSSGWISMKPWRPRAPSSAMRKTLLSASSRICLVSRPAGLSALVAISSPAVTRRRSTERSRTISA